MIGLDTGFFIKLLQGQANLKGVWLSVVGGKEKAVVSVLTLFELERLKLKGLINCEALEALREAIFLNCLVVEVNADLVVEAARLSYGLKLATVDSIILASFKLAGCKKVLTTDSLWKNYRSKLMKIEII
ncbi:type II toxin-antitoxin system VapC family toxin [Phorcysia thermohydrogeniphila]|uniref:Putative nucleic acid-binding protein n=1 Tax=Phorcysia thermohydrogeniphila TaxID=936138 RepID=A0A4R1GE49_9BACT|nr:PIN domain-containing protein [Phorcysia thermohydrogeniphila]TCK02482.1 putative nucleic acid-binding protein [Phorcysia thermohydrogeniphila]